MRAFTLFLMVLLMKKVPFPSLSGQTCYTLHEVTWKTVKLLKYKGYNIEVILCKVFFCCFIPVPCMVSYLYDVRSR